MRSAGDVALVRELVGDGLNDCEIARETGIPRTTVRDWRRAEFRPRSAERPRDGDPHIHDFQGLPRSYAYLLGLYLGDGFVARHRRGVYRLRITLDLRYPLIIAACQEAVAQVMPANRASGSARARSAGRRRPAAR
jgi:hypothetical protein